MAHSQPKIIVIGAGIIGACIAWRLGAAGASVTLVDGNGSGGIASAGSFGWINATYGNPRRYFDLRMASMNEWEVLSARFNGLPFQRSGTLYAHFDRVDLPTFQKSHSQWGYNIDWIRSRQHQRNRNPIWFRYLTAACWLKMKAFFKFQMLLSFLRISSCKNGGVFIQQHVTNFLVHQGKITGVMTQDGRVDADHIVVAAGTATQSLLEDIGINIPMRSPPGLLVQTKPYRPIISRTVLTNGLHIQQRHDGSLLAGADFGGGELNDFPEEGAAELVNRIRAAFHSASDVELDRYTLGHRPTPEDGMPVVGASSEISGLYIATMHSGATLAPIVSKFVCEELLYDAKVNMLEPFRPSRFTNSISTEAVSH